MTARIHLVQHDQDATRTVHLITVGDRIVGTAVEIAADRVAPWRLTIRGCCANLRRSSRLVVEQTVERFVAERPDAFAPPPPSARAHAVERIDPTPVLVREA